MGNWLQRCGQVRRFDPGTYHQGTGSRSVSFRRYVNGLIWLPSHSFLNMQVWQLFKQNIFKICLYNIDFSLKINFNLNKTIKQIYRNKCKYVHMCTYVYIYTFIILHIFICIVYTFFYSLAPSTEKTWKQWLIKCI